MKLFGSLLARASGCAAAMIGMASLATAQLVFVPDTNLRTALNEWVPGAVDASGYLDTGNPAVSAQASLELTVDWDPADLTGIDALGNLASLVIHGRCHDPWTDQSGPCDSSHFSIPAWPGSLLSLTLDRGTWSALPAFPVGLNLLHLNVTGMPLLPALPDAITDLALMDKSTLTNLPNLPASVLRLSITSVGHAIPDLPDGLTYLYLTGVLAITVPPLPGALDSIYLSTFGDTAIPTWPAAVQLIELRGMPNLAQVSYWPSGLQYLSIHEAPSLAQVPDWPSTLSGLQLWNTDAIAALPAFPPGLETIGLVSNGMDTLSAALASLPPWPANIQTIFLASMSFSELPPFPAGLQVLDISFLHELTCLPVLPAGLQLLNLDVDPLGFPPTSISCLPNYPPNATVNWGGTEIIQDPDLLCTSLNSSCDFLNPVATGTAYWDQSADGAYNPGETGYPYVTLHQQPGNAMHGVATDGAYAWPMPIGSYTVSATGDSPYIQSIAPAQHSLSFTLNDEVSTGNDFGILLEPNVQDLRIDLTGPWGQPGFDSPGTITCENVGTIPMDATVTFQLDADQSWVGAVPAPTSVTGNTITWNLNALQVGETRQIALTVHTDAGVALGTSLVQSVELGPVQSDQTPADNVANFTTEVVGSIDPNDKQVWPATLTPSETAAGINELTYTIRFQNTGTWPATKVVVVDTLSPDLQWSSFRKISSSHPCTWELDANGVLSFQFDPIELPDSTNNEPNSHGFVKFAIKPAGTLMLGTVVENFAGIYFDFNAPVVTPPAVFTVAETSGISEQQDRGPVVYPNPVGDVLWVHSGITGNARIQIVDALGREVISMSMVAQPRMMVPAATLSKGSYAVRIISESGIRTAHFMKE